MSLSTTPTLNEAERQHDRREHQAGGYEPEARPEQDGDAPDGACERGGGHGAVEREAGPQ